MFVYLARLPLYITRHPAPGLLWAVSKYPLLWLSPRRGENISYHSTHGTHFSPLFAAAPTPSIWWHFPNLRISRVIRQWQGLAAGTHFTLHSTSQRWSWSSSIGPLWSVKIKNPEPCRYLRQLPPSSQMKALFHYWSIISKLTNTPSHCKELLGAYRYLDNYITW